MKSFGDYVAYEVEYRDATTIGVLGLPYWPFTILLFPSKTVSPEFGDEIQWARDIEDAQRIVDGLRARTIKPLLAWRLKEAKGASFALALRTRKGAGR